MKDKSVKLVQIDRIEVELNIPDKVEIIDGVLTLDVIPTAVKDRIETVVEAEVKTELTLKDMVEIATHYNYVLLIAREDGIYQVGFVYHQNLVSGLAVMNHFYDNYLYKAVKAAFNMLEAINKGVEEMAKQRL